MPQELDIAIELPGDELPPATTHRLSIAGYDILEWIGAGGMGVVYRARHRQLGRTVALKLLRAGALAGPTERHRFLREARAGAGLQRFQYGRPILARPVGRGAASFGGSSAIRASPCCFCFSPVRWR